MIYRYRRKKYLYKNIWKTFMNLLLIVGNAGAGTWSGYSFYTSYVVTKGYGYFFLINTAKKVTSLWTAFGGSVLLILLINMFVFHFFIKHYKKTMISLSAIGFLIPMIRSICLAVQAGCY